MLTARTLASGDVHDRKLTAIAFCPGQVFGTGLARNLSLPWRIAWSVLGTPVLGWPARRLNSTLNTRADAGRARADLVLGHVTPANGRHYAALRRGRLTWPEASELARNDDLATALWTDSARLVDVER